MHLISCLFTFLSYTATTPPGLIFILHEEKRMFFRNPFKEDLLMINMLLFILQALIFSKDNFQGTQFYVIPPHPPPSFMVSIIADAKSAVSKIVIPIQVFFSSLAADKSFLFVFDNLQMYCSTSRCGCFLFIQLAMILLPL